VFFDETIGIIGEVMSLEALREGVLGGYGMAAFIEVAAGNTKMLDQIADQMELIVTIGWTIFAATPSFLKPIAAGYWDYLVGVT
jgi:hypothetical protein